MGFPRRGAEGNETPFECVAREVEEELNISLNQDSILFERMYPAMHDASLKAYFMVAEINNSDIANIVFGDEGQGWKMIKIDSFMADDTVIDPLKGRLRDYLATK